MIKHSLSCLSLKMIPFEMCKEVKNSLSFKEDPTSVFSGQLDMDNITRGIKWMGNRNGQ